MMPRRATPTTVAVAIIVAAIVIAIGIATGNRASAATDGGHGSRTVAVIYGCHAEDDCHADYRADGSWRIIRNGHR